MTFPLHLPKARTKFILLFIHFIIVYWRKRFVRVAKDTFSFDGPPERPLPCTSSVIGYEVNLQVITRCAWGNSWV